MLYKRSGFPEEDEIVLCKVTKIFPNSVFVDLLEYNDSGMIHISEIAPGRIRNLRDYVSVGREIVCKVLRVDKEKGHIDLSLRRVNSHQRQEKLDEIKQELKAESLIKNIAKNLRKPVGEVYEHVSRVVFRDYSHLFLCFKDIVSGQESLEAMGLEKTLAKEITKAVLDKFKPEKISISGEIRLQTYDPDGIGKIKATLQEVEELSPTLRIFYLGAGRYRIIIEDVDYKPAEKTMEKVQEILTGFNDKVSVASFEREKSE